MPAKLELLLDENIPKQVLPWLRNTYSDDLEATHVFEIGLRSAEDQKILQYAIENNLVVLTYDEDFTDRRMLPNGHHPGVIRLRVWPTDIETTKSAITRVLHHLDSHKIRGHLIIVDRDKIRVRQLR